jgi:hypothetical protein
MNKRIATATVFVAISIIVSLAWAERAPSHADQFVNGFVKWMGIRRMQVTVQEQRALRDAHPVLLRAADDEYLPMLFWETVRQAPSEKIEWAKARQLIQKGKVAHIFLPHGPDVSLTTRDGRKYSTREPRAGLAAEALREVDPKGVFVICDME